MSTYDLPTTVEVGGVEYEVRSDYRAILDVCEALNDPELADEDRALVALDIFYPRLMEIPAEHYQEAIEKCFQFINCGDTSKGKSPKLVDWKQDFKQIVGPVNRVIGQEVRAAEYLHWWTLMSAYYEIGDCTFAQIVRIRSMKAAGKPLDKSDREWYQKNRELVDFEQVLTEQENELLDMWVGNQGKVM